jgi:hypothetical protein
MSHFISLQDAIDLTVQFRTSREAVLASLYQDQNILPLSETFDRAAIDTLLAQTGCEKMRIYYGMTEDYQLHAVLVGVDENNEDMLAENLLESEEDILLEKGFRCPEICPPSSPLNS